MTASSAVQFSVKELTEKAAQFVGVSGNYGKYLGYFSEDISFLTAHQELDAEGIIQYLRKKRGKTIIQRSRSTYYKTIIQPLEILLKSQAFSIQSSSVKESSVTPHQAPVAAQVFQRSEESTVSDSVALASRFESMPQELTDSVQITPSLFAHIENEAFLKGTVDLQGNQFINTVGYLSQYIRSLRGTEEYPKVYDALLHDALSLTNIDERLKTTDESSLESLAKELVGSIDKLAEGKSLLIPGGWRAKNHGHAMIYQITRRGNGYQFTVFNAGDGLSYHAKKSARHKEEYNPMKVWFFEKPNTSQGKNELVYFISRLLKPRLPPHPSRQATTAETLYTQILPSISYLNGNEIDANAILKEHAYTGGQLSGTCTQRVVHQMLKINSPTPAYYQQFIFKFKHHALRDYIESCSAGKCPFTPAVANQINLAIKNNLKILNTLTPFGIEEKNRYLKEISDLKNTVESLHVTVREETNRKEIIRPFGIIDPETHGANRPIYRQLIRNSVTIQESLTPDMLSQSENRTKILSCIERLELDEIEELVLALPSTLDDLQLNELAQLENFKESITALIKRLTVYKNPQTPAVNVMMLSLMTLLMDAQNKVAEEKRLPSFKPFTDSILGTFINNQKRNPLYATNHPQLDQKIIALQMRFKDVSYVDDQSALHAYFNTLLETTEELKRLKQELVVQYNESFGNDPSELHTYIRNQGLQAIYMLTKQYKSSDQRENERFSPLRRIVDEHMNYEKTILTAIIPFLQRERRIEHLFEIMTVNEKYYLLDTLFTTFLPYQSQSGTLSAHKYAIKDSPARDALEDDISNKCPYYGLISARSANQIQLISKAQTGTPVTSSDIVARDYVVLRSVPSYQIQLTVGYFLRHIEALSDPSNQRYLEANLFQPGLLLDALKKPEFLMQFDRLCLKGLHYFKKNGEHNRESLLFVRLDFLISRYFALMPSEEGLRRLQNTQQALEKQLSLENKPEVEYFLQEYLFLTLITRCELEKNTNELLAPALHAYLYLKAHTNPKILEDDAHSIQVTMAMRSFQKLIQCQPTNTVKTMVANACPGKTILSESGAFQYDLMDKKTQARSRVDVISGRVFVQELAVSGLPSEIQHHPLMKQLDLQNINECFINSKETYLELHLEDGSTVCLNYGREKLVVSKMWVVGQSSVFYTLQPLTNNHLAKHADRYSQVVSVFLPKILTDGSMNFWSHSSGSVLTKNNKPVYRIQHGQWVLLDDAGNRTNMTLVIPPDSPLAAFESKQFMLTHKSPDGRLQITLPRYGLSFEKEGDVFVNTKTQQRVVDKPSPIHPSVAGLMVERNGHASLLIPVHKCYATVELAEQSDVYPVVHDIKGVVPEAALNEQWKRSTPSRIPQWHYQDSERFISFPLNQNGDPIPNTAADALYLAYIYLATHQPEKAWSVLEDCKIRLGGLTGDPAELRFIRWICKEMPHVLPGAGFEDRSHPARSTPSDVGCQLKAMGLLSDFLLNEHSFDLQEPICAERTANAEYAEIEYQRDRDFLKTLPNTIYQDFSRYQKMGRYLDHDYLLDIDERKSLLNYYEQSQPKNLAPRGALGYEWMCLSLHTLMQEREALQARETVGEPLSKAHQKRLQQIETHIQSLKPVMALSTTLERVPFDIGLPADIKIKKTHLEQETITAIEQWSAHLPGVMRSPEQLQESIKLLSSKISEREFIENFPAYFQIAYSYNEGLRQSLLNFCEQTLIANRHLSLANQPSNHVLFCNVLYHILSNPKKFRKYIASYEKNYSREPTFEDIIATVSNYAVLPLMVYQAKDVYQEILATPEDILSHPAHQTPIPLRATSGTPFKEMVATIVGEEEGELGYLLTRYRFTQTESADKINSLGAVIDECNHSDKPIEKKLEILFEIEQEAGFIQFEAEQSQRQLARDFIQQPELVASVCQKAESEEQKFRDEAQRCWSRALDFANRGPEDPILSQAWSIERQAKGRPILTQADLLSLYCRANAAESIEATGLTLEEVKELHDMIHQAIVGDILTQICGNIKTKLHTAQTKNDPILAAQALDLLVNHEIPGLDEPAMMVIQHEEKILLRPRQVSALSSLLQQSEGKKLFHETIEKITMGGGKSKVILPIVAEKKAEGHNLVVIEVPQALLATNHVDLNRVSERLFRKKAHRFEFNRDSNHSPESLERMYHRLIEIMTTREYLVTTGESIQSLELKYLELLMAGNEHDEIWKQQVYWLDKVTSLFHNYADCLIDEVHQGLSINKQLNYTTGETIPLSSTLIENAIALYHLIDGDVIKQAPDFPLDYDWRNFQKNLARSLIEHPSDSLESFLSHAVNRYGEEVKDILIDYFSNNLDECPDVVLDATAEEQEMLAFFKAEITILLPQTLSRKVGVNYGSSKLPGLTPIERTLAIPYKANDAPNERSRFGNELEAINYTTQMMLIHGINKELLCQKIMAWQIDVQHEFIMDSKCQDINTTPTARGFSLMTGGLSLGQIDVHDNEQMSQIHKELQFNKILLQEFLRDCALNQIRQDSSIIHSDAFNHADLCHTMQGISGTPNIPVHLRLTCNKATSLGADGYILSGLSHKETSVSGQDYQTLKIFLQDSLLNSASCKRTRSIIDINATFNGVTTWDIAQEIAALIRANPDAFSNPIQHVLYFNDENILCAIKMDKPDDPIILGTSNESELLQVLGSSPEERFTYYDQAHTLGTDIKQASNAHALVLVDEKTTLEAFLQGSMRMRELSLDQSIELIVPKRIAGVTREALIHQQAKNEQEAQLKNNIYAAKARMMNLIRRNLITRIQDLPTENISEKVKLTEHFKTFFASSPSFNLFLRYGGINKKKATRDILQQTKIRLFEQWRACLTSANCVLSLKECQELESDFQLIIDDAIANCLTDYEDMNDGILSEVEAQQEIHQQVAVASINFQESYSPSLQAADEKPWRFSNLEMDMRGLYENVDKPDSQLLTLNKVCTMPGAEACTLFSPNLMTSANYAQTYIGQKEYLNAFLKPVFIVWYHLDDSGILHATIVTPQESLALPSTANHWLSTTEDDLLSGVRPEGILTNPDYLAIKEQIRFFNGELSPLINQETPFCWLEHQSEKKIEFFDHYLKRYRPCNENDFLHLSTMLTQSNMEGFRYIEQHAFDNNTTINWKTHILNSTEREHTAYRQLAEVFQHINQRGIDDIPDIGDLKTNFRLPIKGISYVDNHLEYMRHLKQLRDELIQRRPNDSAMPKIIHMSLQSINTQLLDDEIAQNLLHDHPSLRLQSLNERFPFDETAQTIHILLVFREHPALTRSKAMIDNYLVDIAVTSRHLKQLLAINDLSEVLMEKIIEKFIQVPEDVPIELVKKCTNINQIRRLFQRRPLSDEVLMAMFQVDFLDNETRENIIIRPDFSLALVRELITYQHPIDEDLFNQLVLKLINCDEEHSAESAMCLAQLFERVQNDYAELPQGMSLCIQKHSHSFSPAIQFFILNHFGERILPQEFSLVKMIEKATDDELLTLFKLERKFNVAEVGALIEKSKPKAPGDPDLMIDILCGFRKYLTLNEQRLLIDASLADVVKTREHLEKLLVIEDPSDFLMEKMIEKFIQLPDDVPIKLVKKCKNINQVKHLLQRQPLSSEVLRTLFQDHLLNDEAREAIIAHHDFSPAVVQEILIHHEGQMNGDWLAQMAFKVFSCDKNNSKECGACLTKLFERVRQDNAMTARMREFIQDKSSSFPPSILCDILRLFNDEAILPPQFSFVETIKQATDEELLTLVELRKRFNLDEVSQLIEKVESKVPVDVDRNINMLCEFRKYTTLNEQRSLIDASLAKSADFVMTREHLERFLAIEDPPDFLIEKMIEKFVQLSVDFPVELVRQVKNIKQVNMLLQQSSLSGEILMTLVQADCMDRETRKKIINREDFSLEVIKNFLSDPQRPRNCDWLAGLALKFGDCTASNPEASQVFLAKLYDECAENGIDINHQDWITERHLQLILDNSRNFLSITKALSHPLLTPEARENWFRSKKHLQITSGVRHPDLIESLSKLKLKALEFSIKAIHDGRYQEAAKTCFELYQRLHGLTEAYDAHKNGQTFQQDCDAAIAERMSVLKMHRGVKKYLIAVVNAICNILPFTSSIKDWRCFNTDRANVVEQFKSRLQEATKTAQENENTGPNF